MACERRYEIAIRTPTGDLVDIINNEYSCRWTLRANKVGVLVLELPAEYCSPFSTFAIGSFSQDYRIELWRYVDGVQSLVGNACWFINYLAIVQDASAKRTLRVEAESALGLAGRRTVAYQSHRNAADLNPRKADNLLRYVMRNNFASAGADTASGGAESYNTNPSADANRTAIATYLTIGADLTECTADVEMNIAHQPVLQALGRIADTAFGKGEALFFDIQQISETTNPFLEFVTAVGQLGTDRTVTTGNENAVVIDTSDSGGAINDYTLALDWRESAYRVYAGSQGRGSEQVFQTVDDADLAAMIAGTGAFVGAANPFALREAYIGTNEASIDTQKINDQAQGELSRLLPKVDVHGKFAENETFQWGVDWDFHDRLTLLADGTFVDVFVETIEGEIVDGRDSITGTFSTSLHRSLDGIAKVVQDTKRLQWWVKHLNSLESGSGGGGTLGTQTLVSSAQVVGAGYSYSTPFLEIANGGSVEIANGGVVSLTG